MERLSQIQLLSLENAQFTVLTGRRRVGKTQLVLKSTEDQLTLYFFVSRKAELFLCHDFVEEFGNEDRYQYYTTASRIVILFLIFYTSFIQLIH